MAVFTVTTLADENDAETGAGPALGAGLSLREAIALANADSDADTIEFASDLSGGTITLAHGQLEILDSVTIDAGGLDSRLTLDAGGNSRVLHLVDGDIGIENININNGTVTGDGTTHAYGGGVLIEAGNTTLTNVVFDGNRACGGPDQENGWGIGGAIYVEGSATLNLVVTEDIDQPNTNFAVVGDYYQAGYSNYFNAGFIFLDRDAVDLTITVADGVQYDVYGGIDDLAPYPNYEEQLVQIIKAGNGVLAMYPATVYVADGIIVDDGIFEVHGPNNQQNVSAIEVNDGAALYVCGEMRYRAVFLNDGATLDPGGPGNAVSMTLGQYTGAGTYGSEFRAGSTATFDLVSTSDFDQIDTVYAYLQLSGDIALNIDTDFYLNAEFGDEFLIIDGATGEFANLQDGETYAQGGYVFSVRYGDGTGSGDEVTLIYDSYTPPPTPPPTSPTPVPTVGADEIDLSLYDESELFAGDGADSVTGSDRDEVVYGNLGDDVLTGGGGTDNLYGGKDNDDVRGGDGDDAVYGNLGDDVIGGDNGNDVLYGGQGNDESYGNTGIDILYGGLGSDTSFGGQDGDVLYGNLDNDALFGNLGDDVLYGGQGDDTLVGGDGRDTLIGGKGADFFSFPVATLTQANVIADYNAAEGDVIDIDTSLPMPFAVDGDNLIFVNGLTTVTVLGVTDLSAIVFV